jgi:hypothetical protein
VPDDNSETWKEFHDAVNMTAAELEKWLKSDESKEVGQKSGGRRVDRSRERPPYRQDPHGQ